MLPRYLITPMSRNVKTGPIMVTTSDMQSCPSSCPLKANGCYAEHGPLGYLWRGLSATAPGASFKNGSGRGMVKGIADLVSAIGKHARNSLWRHNQAGDLYADASGAIDTGSLIAIVDANAAANARGFTYTHRPVLGNSTIPARNRGAIQGANDRGFVINLSGNNLAHADKLAALAIAPVVAVVPRDATLPLRTPAGRPVQICPAQTQDGMNCQQCGMCALADRDFIIGFLAHGAAVKKADAVAQS